MLLFLSLIILAFWISRLPHFRSTALRDLPQVYEIPTSPLVSLVVAARNEAEKIEVSVRGLLNQDWPRRELIVVNDRSEDATAEILDRLSREFSELRVIHNRELPDGWLGKCWALSCGAAVAKGEWLIFCDGDVEMRSHCVQAAVTTAEREGYDHVSLSPRMVSSSLPQEVVVASLTFLFYLFQNPRHIFDTKRPRQYLGIGAFNMIRRSLYESFGGHVPLRLEVVDDVFLGMLAKAHGGRSAHFLGHRLCEIHWYKGLWEYVRGLEKNAFAGLRFSWWLLAVALGGQALIFFGPLFLLTTNALLSVASLALSHGFFMWTCARQGGKAWHGIFLLPAILVQFLTFVRSALVISLASGVRWRGSFYPLAQLKEAQERLRGPMFGKNST